MTTKPWYTSKTIWFNLAGAALLGIQSQIGEICPMQYQAAAIVVINGLLRLVTTQGVHFTPPPASVKPSAALAALLMAGWLVTSFGTTSRGYAWDFSAPTAYSASDSSLYFRSLASGSVAQLATGGCYGPLMQLKNNGNWIADFVSVCAHGATGIAGQGTTVIPSLQVLDWWGIRGNVGYDPITSNVYEPHQKDRIMVGFGASIIGVAQQLAPAVSAATSSVINAVTGASTTAAATK